MSNRLFYCVATLFFINCICVNTDSCFAQNLSPLYSFVQTDKNTLQNSVSLNTLAAKFRMQRDSHNQVIRIVHIGDSHIQADWLTERVRELLQNEFGNAGRGLIVPCRVAGTNEPNNFSTMPIGIGGITLRTTVPNASMTITPKNWGAPTNSFLTAEVFCDKNEAFDWEIRDANNQIIANVAADDAGQAAQYSTFLLPSLPTNSFTLQAKPNATGKQATVYGINLLNNQSGVLYHAIGVNGAKYDQYNKAALFAKQLFYLQPDLIIIGLGTNEAQTAVDKAVFKAEIQTLVTTLRTETGAAILLYTPADSHLRGVPNPNLPTVHDAIVEVAAEQNLALWDLYELTGGYHSAMQWRVNGLMAKDGVHYNKAGYYVQGELLYQALRNSLGF
jgi:lysophospholipase L1-like esterase